MVQSHGFLLADWTGHSLHAALLRTLLSSRLLLDLLLKGGNGNGETWSEVVFLTTKMPAKGHKSSASIVRFKTIIIQTAQLAREYTIVSLLRPWNGIVWLAFCTNIVVQISMSGCNKNIPVLLEYSVLIHSGSFVTTRLLEHGPYEYLASWKKAQKFPARKLLLYWSVNCFGYICIYINAHRTTTTCNLFVPFFFWGGDNFQKKVFSQSKNRGHRRVPGILLHIITTYWKLAWNPLLKVRVPGIITKPGIVPGYYPPRN